MADNPNEEELDLVEFEDSDGGTVTLKVERYFFYNGDEYVLLSNDIGSEPPEETVRYVMKVQPLPEEGEDMEEFVPVEEELMEKLIEAAQTTFSADLPDEGEEA
ncbi:MAG: DUF1292 domain-containing protein [Lachnospiraceae bacterium]|jgi:hypothetical protein|nr:DUF1292 domain-containing protein [Lachnospiraceae bacterium]